MLEPIPFHEDPEVRFFEMMSHRELIRLSKESGAPYPWTKDPILGRFKFTNVKREHDWTTRRLYEIYAKFQYAPFQVMIMNCATFRYFGTAEFAQAIGWSDDYDERRIKQICETARERLRNYQVVFTNAYVIGNGGMKGRKEEVVTRVFLKGLSERLPIIEAYWLNRGTWEGVARAMSDAPGFGGTGFMVKETLLDAMMTPAMRSASDRETWTPVGPGAIRGLRRLYGQSLPKTKFLPSILRLREKYHDYFRNSGFMPRVTAHDIQFQLCEFDKYERVRLGEGRPRNDYRPRAV